MVALQRLAFMLGICGSSVVSANADVPSRIIGVNDLTPIQASQADDPRVRSIGRMSLGCTVTHVGNGIAISAGHCFASDGFDGRRGSLPCSSEKQDVRWGVTYGSAGYLTSHCVEVLAIEHNSERDYAIFRVSPVPTAKSEPDFDHEIQTGDEITILSHPRRRPLEWSQWCKVEGLLPKSTGQKFFYACDTEGGSSGAAIFDKKWRIVGIHNLYNDTLDRNAATRLASTPLKAILEYEKNRTIASSVEALYRRARRDH